MTKYSRLEEMIGYEIDHAKFWRWIGERLSLCRKVDAYRGEYKVLNAVCLRFDKHGELACTLQSIGYTYEVSPLDASDLVHKGVQSVLLAAQNHDDLDWVIGRLKYG